jgi:DNA-binding response OmpR family regulator
VTSPLHVLVIEDERDVLDLLAGHLQRLGCRVSQAQSGEQGLDLARAEPPDAVIVDVLLPGIDGREVARQLRADERTRACRIVVSSVLDPHDVSDMSTDAVLVKPFRRASVAQLVETLAQQTPRRDDMSERSEEPT